jgi:hypothetical protein
MIQPAEKFCFCTLALGKKYRILAQQLAEDLAKYAPSNPLVVGTDDPRDFKDSPNIIPFKHHKQGILHCYHDKRFVLDKALSLFPAAIHIDADTRMLADIPTGLAWSPGITGCSENMIEHVKKYNPERLEPLKKVAAKINVAAEDVNWVGESIYVVTRDGGKEKEFVKLWGLIGRYLELNGIHHGDGNVMGLAAAKLGWTVHYNHGWEAIRNITKHLDASYRENSHLFYQEKRGYGDNLKRRLDYHYRLNRARLMALKDFDFYYR